MPATTGTLLLDAARRNMRQYGMLIALGLIVVLFEIWTDGVLLKPNNVTNLVLQNSYILVLAIGMMIVIIATTSICRSAHWPPSSPLPAP